MTFPMEYHVGVNRPARRSVPASLSFFGIFLLSFFLVSAASAQFGSVTGPVAPRTGGVAPPTGAVAGVPLAHNGFVPTSSGAGHVSGIPHSPGHSHDGDGHHDPHHSANGVAYYPYIYGVPVPYSVDVTGGDNPDGDNDDDNDPEYQGGPTIFDRRGSGAASYVPLAPPRPPTNDAVAQSEREQAPEPPQAPTTLVFKDGHQLEVLNYAIVGSTLYDLTPGHPRKVALAELDLSATEKQNDDHGVTFQLPPSAQAN
jgi:hypothetical protein